MWNIQKQQKVVFPYVKLTNLRNMFCCIDTNMCGVTYDVLS